MSLEFFLFYLDEMDVSWTIVTLFLQYINQTAMLYAWNLYSNYFNYFSKKKKLGREGEDEL